MRGAPGCAAEAIGAAGSRAIPFDYVVTLPLTGQPRHVVENEIPISAENGFVATAIGYGLQVDEAGAPVDLGRVGQVQDAAARAPLVARYLGPPAPPQPRSVDLRTLPLRVLPPGALSDGVRIRPSFLRIALTTNGRLSDDLPETLLPELFERLNTPADVSFRYALSDSGRGSV